MHLGLKTLLILGLGAALYACASLEPLTGSDLLKAQRRYPDATLAQLTAGRSLYTEKCGRCHYLYPSSKLTLSGWRKELAAMKVKARLEANDLELITRYLSIGARETEPADSITGKF